ncbi:unnamed protein product [Phytophthora fragariaefolia]|uniref:Unnamed protein product n=1 Tax=Phytophthora fragariaefolia TaxID=1490495 RepID=A0A9W6Y5F7_9STRA|nr:unnamed protein product [Phytophthora fragariaefolia]
MTPTLIWKFAHTDCTQSWAAGGTSRGECCATSLDDQAVRLALSGRSKLTRHAAAMLEQEDVGMRGKSTLDQRRIEQRETREAREMFDIEPDSDSDNGALSEVLSVLDEADREPSSSNNDDSDYEDNAASARSSSDDSGVADEISQGAGNDAAGNAESEQDDAAVADDKVGSEILCMLHPNLHRISNRTYDLQAKRAEPAWFHGVKSSFDYWGNFHEAFDEFQVQSYQQFSKRTSTSVLLRNKQILQKANSRRREGKKQRKRLTLIPEEWITYSKTLVCTHGQPYEPRGKGKRNHNNIRDTKCIARVNVRVTARLSTSWYLRVNPSGFHNHNLNRHIWENYAENRTVKDPKLSEEVKVLRKAGANAQGILQYLRERTEQVGLTEAQRAFAVLEEFCRQHGGNSANVLVDCWTNAARIATFQTARMKRLFKAVPEVIMVDSTHDTNVNRYKLFSFVVHDVFGKVSIEHKDNLRCVVKIFKANNPDWAKIQVVMSDKAVHEKDVLRDELPEARQLLCQCHVITWLKKQAARLAPASKKEVKSLVRLLVYAANKDEYDDAKGALLTALGGDMSHEFYRTFTTNWDSTQDEWVAYKRGNISHLTNNTNNRIETKWGKLKDIINDSFTIDQFLLTLITLPNYAEEQYLAEYHRVGSRPSRSCEDRELTLLALQLSSFAFNLIVKEHALATGLNADYKVELGVPGLARSTRPRSGATYEVNTRTNSNNCIFISTCLLPCRHVMYIRSTCNVETVIPPMGCFATRWIVQSPENNIDAGDLPCGDLKQAVFPPQPKERAITSNTKYSEAKAVTERIVDRMALQSTPTFRVALKWLQDFYEAFHSGDVVEFAERESVVFPGLSQVSSVEGARLSQLSLCAVASSPERNIESGTLQNDENTDIEHNSSADKSSSTNMFAANAEEDTHTSGAESVTLPSGSGRNSSEESTKLRPKATKSSKSSKERAKAVLWSFRKRPGINGTTKAQRKRAQAKQDRDATIEMAEKYRQGKISKFVSFDEVAALLDGPYSLFHSKAMVGALVLPPVDISGPLSVREFKVGQDFPVITKIPLLPNTEHKAYVETLNLGVNRVPGDCVNGHQLLDFRENLWLHTTSILLSLLVLRNQFEDVGIISPSYHAFVIPEQKRRVAGGFGASDPNNKRGIGIINIDRHWVSFLVDRTIGEDMTAKCFMFDPLQSKRNYATIEKSMQTVVEHILDLKGKVTFEKIEWCTQQDGSSCGVWCIAVLEMLLSNAQWDDSIYKLVPRTIPKSRSESKRLSQDGVFAHQTEEKIVFPYLMGEDLRICFENVKAGAEVPSLMKSCLSKFGGSNIVAFQRSMIVLEISSTLVLTILKTSRLN